MLTSLSFNSTIIKHSPSGLVTIISGCDAFKKYWNIELEFMNKSDGSAIVANILAQVELELDGVRHLLKQQLILLTPGS